MFIPILQPLSSIFGSNLGSVPHLDFVPTDWLSAPVVPNAQTRVVDVPIALASGRTWLRLKPMSESMGYKLEGKNGRQGVFYTANIAAICNLEAPDTSLNLEAIALHRLLVKLPDLQGNVRLLGIGATFCSLAVGSQINAAVEGKTYYEIELNWEGEQMPAFYRP
jgi:hypothetical protein